MRCTFMRETLSVLTRNPRPQRAPAGLLLHGVRRDAEVREFEVRDQSRIFVRAERVVDALILGRAAEEAPGRAQRRGRRLLANEPVALQLDKRHRPWHTRRRAAGKDSERDELANVECSRVDPEFSKTVALRIV